MGLDIYFECGKKGTEGTFRKMFNVQDWLDKLYPNGECYGVYDGEYGAEYGAVISPDKIYELMFLLAKIGLEPEKEYELLPMKDKSLEQPINEQGRDVKVNIYSNCLKELGLILYEHYECGESMRVWVSP